MKDVLQHAAEARDGVREWYLSHRWFDLTAAVVATTVYAVIVWWSGRFDVLAWSPAADRRTVYTATAVVISLVGALSGVAVGQVGSAKGPRMAYLKRHAGGELAASWRGIYRGVLLAALLALTALVLDRSVPGEGDHNAVVARWAFLFGLALALTKFARLSALFHDTILGAAQDDASASEPDVLPAPVFDEEWFKQQSQSTSL